MMHSQNSTDCQDELDLYKGAYSNTRAVLVKAGASIRKLRIVTNLQDNIIVGQSKQISNYYNLNIKLTNSIEETAKLHEIQIQKEKLKQVPVGIRIAETSGIAVLFLVLGILLTNN